MTAKDPYKYFRVEARELLDALSQGVLSLEKAGASPELVALLLRQAHTLKGAARVVKLAAMADLAHAVEEALAPYREGRAVAPRKVVDGLLKLLDAIGAKLAEIDAPAEAARPTDRRWDTVRLEMGDVDAVLENLSEAAARLALLRRETTGFDQARRLSRALADTGGGASARLWAAAEELDAWLERFHRQAGDALERTERELVQAHERAGRLRLLPAATLFGFLERAARDAAQALGKRVRFEAAGGDHCLDAPVLSALQDALLHVVRNAVAHGLEDGPARNAAGKPPEGLVRLEVARRGGRVSFICRDDGRGIDAAAVRRVALARGLLPTEAPDPLPMGEAARLLLRGGLSTATGVTEVSGRGVGLDAAREAVEKLKGELRLDSEPGRGTTVDISVPYTLSTFPALAVEAGGAVALIPLDGVRRTVRVEEREIAHSPEGETVLFEGKALPFFPLESLFPRAAAVPPRSGARSAVVVKGASGWAVAAVDRVLAVREIVMRPLPELAPADASAAGACLDAQGDPCLVLDPEGLALAAAARRTPVRTEAAAQRPTVLVVDDSLTTRMLEQSILESAGYQTDLAVSAIEALTMARRKRYGLVLVDVEMPGMDGFEFLEKMRDDAELRGVPAILVTSRSSTEDRRRGEAAGARDYIVKGEFDQARLLSRIRELAG